MERYAARWYAMRAVATFLSECPGDPSAVRLREAFDRLKKATDAMVLDVRRIADPVMRAKVGNETFGKRWVQIVYGDG